MNSASVTQKALDMRRKDQNLILNDFHSLKIRGDSPVPKPTNLSHQQHKRSKSDGTDMLKQGCNVFNAQNAFNILVDENDDSD